jgi:hypothetical protein
LTAALSIFADAATVSAVDTCLLRIGAALTWLFAVAFDACRSARETSSMYSLARSSKLVDVDMTLAEVAVQYVSSGKRNTTDVTRVVWVVVVIVSVARKSCPGLVGLAANGAFVHFEASDVLCRGH